MRTRVLEMDRLGGFRIDALGEIEVQLQTQT